MATTELTIRQLADEGGTTPIAPVTVTDAVLKGDGTTLTEELTALNNGLTNINSRKQKLGNTLTAEFVATGAQIDANRIFAMIELPFVVADASYSVTINSCTILGVSSVTPSTVMVDNKTSVGIRFAIPHSGTIRDAFAIVLNLTITY